MSPIDPDKVKLLHGLYKPPRFRRGDRAPEPMPNWPSWGRCPMKRYRAMWGAHRTRSGPSASGRKCFGSLALNE
jgi:hypothetical protein